MYTKIQSCVFASLIFIISDFTVADKPDKHAKAAMASMTSYAIKSIILIYRNRKGVETWFLRQKCQFTVTFA